MVSAGTFFSLGTMKMEALKRATDRSAHLPRDALHTFTNRVIRAGDALGPSHRSSTAVVSIAIVSKYLCFFLLVGVKL